MKVFKLVKRELFKKIFLYQIFLTFIASFFITFNLNYFQVFIAETVLLILFFILLIFITILLNKIFFFKSIFQRYNQEIIVILVFSLNFFSANYAIYFFPIIILLIFFFKKNKFLIDRFLFFFLITSILFPITGILKKTIISNEILVYKNIKNNSENTNSHIFFKKNFFIIVLDQHPSSSLIEKNFPDSNFFIKSLKSNKFYIKDLKAGEGFDTIYAMYKFFNPMGNFDNLKNLSSELYDTFKGNNYLKDIAKSYNTRYLFLDGSRWDSGLLRCNPKLVDACIVPTGKENLVVINVNYFFNYTNSLKINNIINISSKLETIVHSYKNLGDISWNNYRGLVSDFYLNIPNLKMYEPFVIYAHFINPHKPYSRNENCEKFSKVFENDIKFQKFMICTQKMTIKLINIIENNYPGANILIMSDTPAYVRDKNHNVYKHLLDDKVFFAIKSEYLNNFCKKNLNQIKEHRDILLEIDKCLKG
ncbi:hypothetical protein MCEME18_00218 [Candidatus Pelagibacterales bacterium]